MQLYKTHDILQNYLHCKHGITPIQNELLSASKACTTQTSCANGRYKALCPHTTVHHSVMTRHPNMRPNKSAWRNTFKSYAVLICTRASLLACQHPLPGYCLHDLLAAQPSPPQAAPGLTLTRSGDLAWSVYCGSPHTPAAQTHPSCDTGDGRQYRSLYRQYRRLYRRAYCSLQYHLLAWLTPYRR